MSPSLIVADCPECQGVGTVILGTCGVCFAEFIEDDEDRLWRSEEHPSVRAALSRWQAFGHDGPTT